VASAVLSILWRCGAMAILSTATGRVVAFGLMIGGIALLGQCDRHLGVLVSRDGRS
jgi:hypothetical protein